jgi:hypothetical protein
VRRKWFSAFIGLTVLAAFTALGCGSGDEAQKVFTMKEKVVLGKCQWTALSAESMKQTESGAKANGQFVLVELEIKNNGSNDIILTGIEVELLTTDKVYTYDSQQNASFYAAMKKEPIIGGSVKCGQAIKGWVAFDIDESAKNIRLRVRDTDITSNESSIIELNL